MKIKIIIISIFLCQLSLYAGNYYWYKGEKINLEIDSTKINVTTAVDVNLLESLVRFESIKEIKQLERSENNTSLFSVELISKNQYNNIIEYLKSVEDVVCISPYYGKDSNSIGTSSFFCVKLYKENDYELLNNFASQNALKIIKQVPYMPTWYILSNIDSKINSTQASNMVYESGLFADVDPLFMFNFRHNCANFPTDSDFSEQWGLYNSTTGYDINVCPAWDILNATGTGIRVAVFDSGIDKTHIDLATNIDALSYDVQTGVPSILSSYISHGTFVAGIIGAARNGIQVVGVAPNSKLIDISDHTGNSTYASLAIASGINWAWKSIGIGGGVDVINNSWGASLSISPHIKSITLENAIDSALMFGRNGKGCVIVFSSGNRNYKVEYPGSYSNDIIAVGGIQKNGQRWFEPSSSLIPGYGYGANYGTELDIVAPCKEIYSTYNGGTSGYCNWAPPYNAGTSFSAPHVSGVAALILSVNPDLTHQQVKHIIECTAQKIRTDLYTYDYNNPARPNCGWNEEVGYGLVDAYAAVTMAMNYTNYVFAIKLWNEITNSFEILYSKNSCCSNLPAVIPSDTIYYKDENGIEKCVNTEDSNRIYFPLEMTDLDSAIWIIGEDTLQTETEKDSLGYYFPLPDLSEYEDEYLIITVILPDGTEVHFKFRVYDHENVVSNAIPLWQDLLNFDYEIEGNTAIINVDLRNGFTVPLPNIDGCSLSVDVDSSVVWSYDIDSNIVFEPTEECDISGRLVYECECIGVLNINIHNTGCDTIPCNDCVEFLDIENCTQYMTGYSSSKIEKCIQISTKLECADSTGEYKKILKVESVDSLTGNTETIENVARNDYLLVLQSPCVGKDTNVAFYINVTLDDNSICSDTFRFSYKCYSLIDNYYILNMGIWEGWDEVMCIYYGIDRSALGLQLKITIVDVNGAEVLLVYDDVPQTLRGCIDVNISGLPSGQYHLVYQIGDEVFTISFSKP